MTRFGLNFLFLLGSRSTAADIEAETVSTMAKFVQRFGKQLVQRFHAVPDSLKQIYDESDSIISDCLASINNEPAACDRLDADDLGEAEEEFFPATLHVDAAKINEVLMVDCDPLAVVLVFESCVLPHNEIADVVAEGCQGPGSSWGKGLLNKLMVGSPKPSRLAKIASVA